MAPVRSICSSVAICSALMVVPLHAQSVEDALLLPIRGFEDWTPVSVWEGPMPAQLLVAGAMLSPAGTSLSSVLPGGTSGLAAAPVPQQEQGGFPWLHVGIGAGVAALFISAVATANSGESAELPRGGISVVLPGS